jgi:3-deoxy-D-manno-octulosonate 8-phosphate phosphatase (KDO 8-P phosphatase)
MKTTIKLFISEINGVWTDGGFYINGSGNEYLKFHFYDQTGIELLNQTGLPYLIISADKSEAKEKALKKLNVKNYKIGSKNRLDFIESFLEKNDYSWDEVAFLGSSADDLKIIEKAGLSAVPASAPYYVKNMASWILKRKGGEGAFAEFIERYLEENNLLKKMLGVPDLLMIR